MLEDRKFLQVFEPAQLRVENEKKHPNMRRTPAKVP